MSDHLSEKQDKLKKIILRLHKGESTEKVKKDFARLINDISPEEIANLESSLMQEGIPPEEIQRLCEVHVEVFKSSLKKQKKQSRLAGHPIHTYLKENREIKKILKSLKPLLKQLKNKPDPKNKTRFSKALVSLKQINLHYIRKENQLFPKLEEKNFTGPSKVMWSKHDEIRELFKELEKQLAAVNFKKMAAIFATLSSKIKKMIFMEEKILFPTAARKLDEHDWALIRKEEKEIGYAWITPGNLWDSGIILNKSSEKRLKKMNNKTIHLDEGSLTGEQINLILKNLPFDITYVDENDTVLYYTAAQERVFPRSPAIIGRKVQNCHPPKSVHVVEKILKSFKEKKKKVAEFWITINNMFVHIRYFPLYDKKGKYKGVIEVTQNINNIKKLKGEKRLLDWKD